MTGSSSIFSGRSATQRRAIISGGSLGGLLAANMLRATGWHVSVYERAGDDLASRGAGIARTMNCLRSWGA